MRRLLELFGWCDLSRCDAAGQRGRPYPVARALRRAGLATLVVATVTAGCTYAGAPHQPLQPLVWGWEQFFKLEWEPGERNGRPVVRGRIQNEWGFPATKIQLLVDGFDAGGRLVSQDIGWLGPSLPPGIRADFEVPVHERAATYRVSVFAFSWVQTGNGGDFL